MKELYTSPEAILISFVPAEKIASELGVNFREVLANSEFGENPPAGSNKFDLEGDL